MKLLLHVCCADCLIRFLHLFGLKPQDELLSDRSPKSPESPTLGPKSPGKVPVSPTTNPDNAPNSLSDITLFFSNSNIYPRAEYDARLAAVRTLAARYNLPLIIDDYQPEQYFIAVKNNSQFPLRCRNCWQLRLERTSDKMFELNTQKQQLLDDVVFTHFSTTLLVSQYQASDQITQIAHQILESNQLNPSHQPSIHPNFFAPDTTPCQFYRTAGFYKQNYCGCLFSLMEKAKDKFQF
jgi:predicted adenine nucleotide alpha hydrolase (AANH) superfamily ATPase